MNPFLQAYIFAAIWSTIDDNGEPLDVNYSANDLAPEALKRMEKDCNDFQKANADTLQASGLSDEQAGHDFWLTRNGHGTGFWDRGIGENGEKLTEAADAYGECNLYVGDDGKIYSTIR
jgi:hypothetical protein